MANFDGVWEIDEAPRPRAAAELKRLWRAELRAQRRLMTDRERQVARAGLTERLAELMAARPPRCVLAYAARGDEPDLGGFFAEARARGTRVLLPVTEPDGGLNWTELLDGATGEELICGETLGTAAADAADLVLAPALAVDPDSGVRLGQGGGYYDRLFARLGARVARYAVVFDGELRSGLPAEEHDFTVSGVVTPTRIEDFGPLAR